MGITEGLSHTGNNNVNLLRIDGKGFVYSVIVVRVQKTNNHPWDQSYGAVH
jgi:hypothetical protein